MFIQEPATPLLRKSRKLGSKKLRDKDIDMKVADFLAFDDFLASKSNFEVNDIETRVNSWLKNKGIIQASAADKYVTRKTRNASQALEEIPEPSHSKVIFSSTYESLKDIPSRSKIAKRRIQESEFRSETAVLSASFWLDKANSCIAGHSILGFESDFNTYKNDKTALLRIAQEPATN